MKKYVLAVFAFISVASAGTPLELRDAEISRLRANEDAVHQRLKAAEERAALEGSTVDPELQEAYTDAVNKLSEALRGEY